MDLSNAIKTIRVNAGLSRKEFAKMIGSSQSAITYWESGKRQPRFDQLEKIATAFGLDIQDIYKTDTAISKPLELSDTTQILIKNFESLNGKGQSKAIELIDMLTKIPEYHK